MSTVKKIYYFSAAQFNYCESWLEDMAREGFLLKNQNTFTCEFEETKALECKYRIIPLEYADISEEERYLYKAEGWKYIPSTGQSIFLNENPNATELFTDIDSWRKRTKKYAFNRSALWLFFTIYAIWTLCFGLREPWDFISAHTFDIDILVFVATFFLFCGCAICITNDLISIIQFHRTASKNDTIDHNLPYKKVTKRGKIVYISAAIALVAGLLDVVYAWSGGMLSLNDSLAYENPKLVRFSEFDACTWNSYYDLILGKNDESGEYYYDYFINSENTLIRNWAHEGYSVEREVPDPEDEGATTSETIAYYSMEYSEFRNSKMAEKFLAEDIAYDSTWDDSLSNELKPEDISVNCSGADYVGYYSVPEKLGYSGNQTLYLRKGTKLIEVYYQGDKNLLDELDLFVSRLQN